MLRRALPSAALLLAAVACVRTNATVLGTQTAPRPALAEDQVRVFRTASQVPGKYEEVALLNSTASSTGTSEAKMMNSMRKKAGELGANAIILDAISEPSAGAKIAGAVLGTGAERKGRAIAIYIFPAATPTDSSAKK